MSQSAPESMPGDGSQRGHNDPQYCTDLDSVQVFEDHDTRGDPRYPPVKMPRNLPKDMRPRRPLEGDQ